MAEQGEQPAEPESQDGDAALDALVGRVEGPSSEPAQETAPEQPAEAEGGEQPSETPTQEEFDEIEFEAERYKVPKKLKDAFLRQSDYTKKTQEVAEARSMVALQIQAMQQEQQFQTAIAPDTVQLQQLDAAIRQYNGIDWSQLTTDQLVHTKHQLDQLKEKKGEVERAIASKRHQFNQHLTKVQAEQSAKANEWLAKQIPSWGAETVKALNSYGAQEGFTAEELGSIRDPRYVKTLWKAQQYDKLMADKNTVTKRAQGVPPVIKPNSVPAQSKDGGLSEAVKQLHQAKDPKRKGELFDKALELKMRRMGLA